jgi:hypothetical protein
VAAMPDTRLPSTPQIWIRNHVDPAPDSLLRLSTLNPKWRHHVSGYLPLVVPLLANVL